MAPPRPAAGRFGLRLALGALVLLAAAWVFGAIAEDVASGDRITLLDADIASRLHAGTTPALTRAMRLVSDVHSTMAVGAYAVVLGLVLAARRRWWDVLALVTCIGGGMLLNVGMKLAFHRARPVFEDPILTLSTYSFPSGHVAGATLLYGLGVAWVFGRTDRTGWRLAAVAGMALAVGLVAFSRMLLGVHYLTDVVAAFAEGVAWLALCLGGIAGLRRRAAAGPTADR